MSVGGAAKASGSENVRKYVACELRGTVICACVLAQSASKTPESTKDGILALLIVESSVWSLVVPVTLRSEPRANSVGLHSAIVGRVVKLG